jgi:hypothetical protein
VEKKTTFQLLAEEIPYAERIPVDREPTAEEIQQVDDLVARLRVSAPGGKRNRNLFQRASTIRARMVGPRGGAQVEADAECADKPPAGKKISKGFGRIYDELSPIAAITRPLKEVEHQRLDELVEETHVISSKDNSEMFRRLHQRAKLIRKSNTPRRRAGRKPAPPQPEGLRSVLPAGLVGSRGFDLARREVLGGLPSSRRGH